MRILSIRRLPVFLVVLGLGLAPHGPAGAAGDQRSNGPDVFGFEDVFELEVALDPQLSPDGERVVYVRRSMDIMSDKPVSNLWIVDRDGERHRPLHSGKQSASSPRWSPDGDRLAFISAKEGRPQIYSMWLDTGQTAKLSNLTESPGAIAWSPDGEWIAFTMFVEKKKEPLISMPAPPKGAEWAEGADEISSMTYRIDGRGYLRDGYTQLFVIPAQGGTARQLTDGEFNHSGPLAWSPDGSKIYLSGNRHENWQFDPLNSEIYEVTVADASIRALTDRQGRDFSPVLSPDGDRLAYLGNDDDKMSYQQAGLYVMDLDGGNKRLLSEGLDRSVAAVDWAADGNSLYIQFVNEGRIAIAEVEMDGDRKIVVDDAGGTVIGRPYTGANFDAGDGFVYTRSPADRPADLTYVSKRGRTTRLTDLNSDLMGHKTLGAVERIVTPSRHDGREIEAWIVTPPDFDPDRKYPLILEIHGGPYAAYGPNFSAEVQLMAAQGYVVVYVNPRGSTGYGAEFANMIHQNYPSEDFDDLMSAVDAVVARGFVNEDNLFVTGGSGGGVLTAWIVGKTDRFRAAVIAKPVVNWASFVLTSDFSVLFADYWFGGPPWEMIEKYWVYSPLSLVGNVTTPSMVMTGEEDFRTPISEIEQYYKALKMREVETVMVRIPGTSHGIVSRPSNLIRKVKYILAWFEQHRADSEQSEEATKPDKAE